MGARIRLLVIVALCICFGQRAFAVEVPRVVVALYDSKFEGKIDKTKIHRLAEMPLNHLGVKLEYHDVNDPLPDIANREDVRGVLTWFLSGQKLSNPREFLQWSINVIDNGKKYVIMGDPGFYEKDSGEEDAAPLVLINMFFAKLGLRDNGNWVGVTYDTDLVYQDADVVGFERKYDGIRPFYRQMGIISNDSKSYLTILKKGKVDSNSELVVVAKNGGYVAAGYAVFSSISVLGEDYSDSQQIRKWYINPFKYFAKVYDLDNLPRPDVTTQAGRRIYYSQIDGDGWLNVSEVEEYRKKKSLSSQVIYDKVVAANPDLPVTVAPIVAEISKSWLGTQESRQIAREFFKLPNVEPSSHTLSHPFYWEFFADGDNEKERHFFSRYSKGGWEKLSLKSIYTNVISYSKEIARLDTDDLHKDKIDILGYDIPRAYALKPFDLKKELIDSIVEINELVPIGKKVNLVQWSGDAVLFEKAVLLTRQAELLNINGGNTRFDKEFDSYGWVSPIGVQVGKQHQIYASMSNENVYTNLWKDNYFAFNLLQTTLKNTEFPIRLRPIDIYYHMYSGEKLASLKALLSNIDYAKSQKINPITTSNYAAICDGFYSINFDKVAANKWLIKDRGSLQTIRFDNADKLGMDMANSKGVIGFNRYQGSLYIYLDKNEATPEIVLTELGLEKNENNYLVDSRWQVYGVRGNENGSLDFIATGFGNGEMRWKVAKDGRYNVISDKGYNRVFKSNNGYLDFSIETSAIEPINISLSYLGS